MNVQDVIALGKLFRTGEVNRRRVVAITGNEVKKRSTFQLTAVPA